MGIKARMSGKVHDPAIRREEGRGNAFWSDSPPGF
jgi:hypothetical protein